MRIKRIAAIGAALAAAGAVAVYATLSSLEFEELRGIAESEVRRATGRALKVAGPIDLEISLNPAISLDDVSFANAPWGSRPDMVTVKRLELEVSLWPLLLGDIRINRLVLVEPDVLLETGPDGVGNWVFNDAPPDDAEDSETPGTLPSFSELAVRDGRAVFRDGKSGQDMQLHIGRAVARAASHTSPLVVSLSGAANDTAFQLEGTFGSPEELAAGEVFPLMVIGEVAGVRLDVEGQIDSPLTKQIVELSILLKGESLGDLSALAGTSLPRSGPFSVAVQLHRDGPEVEATDLAIQIGGSDLAGNLRLSLAKARPAVTGKLTASLIDLADILPPADESESPPVEETALTGGGASPSGEGESPSGDVESPTGKKASPANPPQFIFPETPLPMEALAAVDGDISFGADVLRLSDSLALADVELGMALKDGLLVIQPLSAKLSEGTAVGTMSLDTGQAPPVFALQLDAKNVEYGQLLAAMDIVEGVAGTLEATVDVRGAGLSPRAIAAGLNGRIHIVAGKGRIDSEVLGVADTGLFEMFSRWGPEGDDLPLNCAVASFPVKDGVATSEAILLDTGTVTVGSEGHIDLRDETLEFRVSPQAKQVSLLSLAVPFTITGPLRQPAIGIDPLGAATGVVKVAGIFFNPLVAGAALLLDTEADDRNLCVAALEKGQAAANDEAQPQAAPTAPETVVDKTTEGVTGAIEGVGEGVTDVIEGVGEGVNKGLKNLFGD